MCRLNELFGTTPHWMSLPLVKSQRFSLGTLVSRQGLDRKPADCAFSEEEGQSVSQIFGPAANSIARVVLISVLAAPFVIFGLGYAGSRSQYITGASITLDQPVPFSHEHHVGRPRPRLPLLPRVGRELGVRRRAADTHLHDVPFAALHPGRDAGAGAREPRRAQADPLAAGQPLPDYVYFDHSIHIAKGVGCTTCHGPVETMPLMRQAEPLTMGWCLDCHRDPAPYLRAASRSVRSGLEGSADQLEEGRKLLAPITSKPNTSPIAPLPPMTHCHPAKLLMSIAARR